MSCCEKHEKPWRRKYPKKLNKEDSSHILDDQETGFQEIFKVCLEGFVDLLYMACARYYRDYDTTEIHIVYPQVVYVSLENIIGSKASIKNFLHTLYGSFKPEPVEGTALFYEYGNEHHGNSK